MEKEELIVYLATAKETVSAVLMTEKEAKQMPIYFVSRALRGPELNYTSMEKLVLALVHASKPRVSVKRQILADFIVERPEEDSPDTSMEEKEELPEPWILFTNGSSCTDGSGAGLILTNPRRDRIHLRLKDSGTNGCEKPLSKCGFTLSGQSSERNVCCKGGRHDPLSVKSKSTYSFAYLSKQVLVEELKEKSISKVEILTVVEEEGDTWMTPIYKYLAEETLPADMKKARAIRRKSWRFAVINGIIYKKSFLGPWLRCVGPLQANYVLTEIHEGSCSMHAGTRYVVAKALRTGYYWPTMHRDARALIRACQDCQVHKLIPRNPQQKLNPITSPGLFYKWGIDIAGPFPEGPGKVKFLIVVMDYFTKWIEAKPVATITGNQIKKFVWDNIVCRFELPEEIISDNGKQFRDDPFKDWNKSKVGSKEQELDGRTPLFIPAEIGMPTIRTAEVDQVQNNEALQINLDLLEEKREETAIREARSKAKMEKYYNAKVQNTSFKPGDLVYRNNDASRAEDTGKLGPKWEGPYEVTKALRKEAYKLRDRDGKHLPRTWNISNLKKCYVHKM
ncbi:reverse transcriptase domain-containing protein [Tanacetum coccineum]